IFCCPLCVDLPFLFGTILRVWYFAQYTTISFLRATHFVLSHIVLSSCLQQLHFKGLHCIYELGNIKMGVVKFFVMNMCFVTHIQRFICASSFKVKRDSDLVLSTLEYCAYFPMK
ncbi:hypothetical protein ACJX0J_016404, partial [Zea mays]